MAARKAEPGFTYEEIARAALERDDVVTVPRLIRSFRKREICWPARAASRSVTWRHSKICGAGSFAIDFGRRLFQKMRPMTTSSRSSMRSWTRLPRSAV